MKKKKEEKLSDKVFNVVLVIVLIGLAIVIATSPMANFSMSGDIRNKDDNMKYEKPVPSELKWHDSFKGISNEGKKEDKDNMNFYK